ncbi:RNA polymerase sigma factor SigM [Actinopolymorpha singaporensis]|uniref:RNA polymerase sigma-70 factor, ECF subfamily n=1 Tax=Actinopolymorpha singaporensis TaxID=117157 RepID=A0A1H1N6T6_9ACTN|nr:RNA polymerase sigma factor SigM [Actinopolymorpha singaporensis]SDR93859.1 RNA polymerase sigma-70 factor, ECF subfamily [Actinopolymorpha singaporensis]
MTTSTPDTLAEGGGAPTDRDLIAAHVAGDPEAFATLFRRHRDRLWAVALRTMSDPDEAADALQDALISAFRNAGQFRGDSAVTTWLHRVVVNACLDRIRRRAVRAADPLPEDDRAAELAADRPPDPAEVQELRIDVLTALDSLNPDQRAAIVLVDMEGYSVEEAAQILECAPGTIKSRCARGRARLVPLLAHLRPTAGAVSEPAEAGGNHPAPPDVQRVRGTRSDQDPDHPWPSATHRRGGTRRRGGEAK